MATMQEDTFTIPRQVKRTQLREEKPCTFPSCDRFQWSRGYCSKHYTRLKKSGKLEPVKGASTIVSRFQTSFTVNSESGCWEWHRSVNDKGYGVHPIGRKLHKAHRLSYEWHVGEVPAGQMVLHKCDNTVCVNPDHLFLGDNALNMQDCVAKGRHRSQTGIEYRNLTRAMVLNVRIMFARGELSMCELSKIHGVEVSTISNLLTGKTHQRVS